MEDEIKIVNCGCGGKSMLYISPITTRCLLQCESCKIETAFYDTEIEAVEAWNKAMGAKDINVPNKVRTAKVVSDDVIITVNGYRYHYEEYLCNACKKKVFSCDSYCSHCGAKLDWSGNE